MRASALLSRVAWVGGSARIRTSISAFKAPRPAIERQSRDALLVRRDHGSDIASILIRVKLAFTGHCYGKGAKRMQNFDRIGVMRKHIR